jgi:integrase
MGYSEMATFLKKGNWYIDYWMQGQRYRKKIGPSRKLAKLALKKIQIALAENRYLDIKKDEKIKFKDFAHLYIENYAKPNKRSWRSDANSLKSLIPCFGEKYLYSITPELIERFKKERINKVSAGSVNREVACLKYMFSRAIEWGKATENPVKRVKLFKENNCRVRYLTEGEKVALLANCPPKLRAVVEVALNTGMRKGEIQNLKWEDVDFLTGIITLTRTKNNEKKHLPMNERVRSILTEIKKRADTPYVFHNKEGKPYHFRKTFSRALTRAKISNFHFHDLRHSFASYLAMKGVDLNTIRELMGHKSLAMTLRYAHLSQSHKSKAVALLVKNENASTPLTADDFSTRSGEGVFIRRG